MALELQLKTSMLVRFSSDAKNDDDRENDDDRDRVDFPNRLVLKESRLGLHYGEEAR